MPVTLTLCLIVKNEASHLPRCLSSVGRLADELIVVDTGSTDETPEIASRSGASVFPFDFCFVDFAAARNYAIARARGRWLLFLDADETLEEAALPELKDLIAGHQNVGYFLERRNHWADAAAPTTDYVVRLFPNHPHYRYRGRVHETVDASILEAGGRLEQSGIRIDHKFSSDDASRRSKNHRYIQILKEEIAADPTDYSRLDFLAAEYHQLEMFDEATAVAEQIALARPNDPQAHLFAGVYHLLYKPDLLKARADFTRALDLRPNYPEAESFLLSLQEREKAANAY